MSVDFNLEEDREYFAAEATVGGGASGGPPPPVVGGLTRAERSVRTRLEIRYSMRIAKSIRGIRANLGALADEFGEAEAMLAKFERDQRSPVDTGVLSRIDEALTAFLVRTRERQIHIRDETYGWWHLRSDTEELAVAATAKPAGKPVDKPTEKPVSKRQKPAPTAERMSEMDDVDFEEGEDVMREGSGGHKRQRAPEPRPRAPEPRQGAPEARPMTTEEMATRKKACRNGDFERSQ